MLLALESDSLGLLSASTGLLISDSFFRFREEKSGLVRTPRPDPGVRIGLRSDGRGAMDGAEVDDGDEVDDGAGRGV